MFASCAIATTETTTHEFSDLDQCLGASPAAWSVAYNPTSASVALGTSGSYSPKTPLKVTHPSSCTANAEADLTVQLPTTFSGNVDVLGSLSINGAALTATPSTNASTCVRVITGTGTYDDGYVSFEVNLENGGYSLLVPAASSSKGTTVIDRCWEGFRELRVRNSNSNAWIGAVEYSTDGGSTWTAFSCLVAAASYNGQGCVGTASVVDGKKGPCTKLMADGDNNPDTDQPCQCDEGQYCTLVM